MMNDTEDILTEPEFEIEVPHRHEKKHGRADTDCRNFKEIGHFW